jgi:acetoacetyl-CoA reductase
MTSRVALVTGGTGGIGTAIVKRLADMGHKVATNYRNEEKARAWQEQMKAAGYDIAIVKGDVTSPQEAEAMVAKSRPARARSTSWSTTPASPATAPSTR